MTKLREEQEQRQDRPRQSSPPVKDLSPFRGQVQFSTETRDLAVRAKGGLTCAEGTEVFDGR
jgi:hypothetical protein